MEWVPGSPTATGAVGVCGCCFYEVLDLEQIVRPELMEVKLRV